jgi:hypothetical protein
LYVKEILAIKGDVWCGCLSLGGMVFITDWYSASSSSLTVFFSVAAQQPGGATNPSFRRLSLGRFPN